MELRRLKDTDYIDDLRLYAVYRRLLVIVTADLANDLRGMKVDLPEWLTDRSGAVNDPAPVSGQWPADDQALAVRYRR